MKKKELIRTRRFKLGVYSFGSILAIAGIILLLNYLSFHIFKRIDLTAGGIYSLSKASKQILRSLDDPVLIKCFFTRNLPPPYNTQGKYLKDLLVEYRAHSRGKVKYEFMDPTDDAELKKEARMSGIRPLTFTQVKSDKYEMKEGYMGIIFLYEDKKEIIPFVKNVSSLEYDLTSHIKKITRREVKVVGFLQGHDEPDMLGNDFSMIQAMITRNYELKAVKIPGNDISVPADIDALIIMGPRQNIQENELYAIDQFIMKGNPTAFLVDNINIDMQTFRGTPINNNLPQFIEGYGIKLKKGVVLDKQNQIIGVQTKRGLFSVQQYVNFPLLVVVTNFKKDNPIVKDMQKVTLAFVSPLEIMDETADTEILAQSSKNSWYKEAMMYFDPLGRYFPAESDSKGPFPLVAIAKGKLKSNFADKDIRETRITEKTIRESSQARILVAGSSKFAQPQFADPPNVSFFLNIVDWLAQDNALISIRTKTQIYRPLKDVSKTGRFFVKWLNVFLMPILFTIYGIIRWRIRQSQKKRMIV